MPKAAVYNEIGEKVSEMDLKASVFGIEKIDSALVHQAVRSLLSNARKPLAHSKNRGEVAGSGIKPWKQKGTGRARAGSIRSPLWRGGGITFGPRNNRNYFLKMNRSAFRKALLTILSDKFKENRVIILDELKPVNKTGELAKKITKLALLTGLTKNYLIILPSLNKDLRAASRNLKNITVTPADQLNVIDLLKNDLIIAKEAIPVIEKAYLRL